MSCTHYTQLSYDERVIIANRHQNGEDYKTIAKSLNRHRSTIWRELHRNGKISHTKTTRVNRPRLDARNCKDSPMAEKIKASKRRYEKRLAYFKNANTLYYFAGKAHKLAFSRIKYQPLLLERLDNPKIEELLSFIITTLDSGWSPEQISGRIKIEGIYPYISAKTIYTFIRKHKELKLKDYLPRKGKRYKVPPRVKYNQSQNRRSIDERPKVVDLVVRIGDLEGDTIVSKSQKDRLLTHSGRLSGKVSISRVLDFNTTKIKNQSLKDLERVFGKKNIHTITYDNGCEFNKWQVLEKELQEDNQLKDQPIIYFAHPYRSSERGRNENINGLIRRFLPKGTDFRRITDDDIIMIESLLNNRPRKRFGWLTPNEVYDAYVALEGLM